MFLLHSPSSMLKSYCSFNPLWTMNTTIFQETSNLYHILEPIKTFSKNYFRMFTSEQFHWSIQVCKETLQHGFGAFFFQSRDRLFFPFFLSGFFSRSFLIFMVTSDCGAFWINCAFVSLITSIFNGSEMNCRIVDWSEGFPNMVVWKWIFTSKECELHVSTPYEFLV